MAEVTFEVVKSFGDLSEPDRNGWRMQLNKVSWNGNEPKWDVRRWNKDLTKMSKGLTFTDEEIQKLVEKVGRAMK